MTTGLVYHCASSDTVAVAIVAVVVERVTGVVNGAAGVVEGVTGVVWLRVWVRVEVRDGVIVPVDVMLAD
jgi:hypothetical protein